MRIASIVFSCLVAVLLTTVLLVYMPSYIGQQRIYIGGQPAARLDTTQDSSDYGRYRRYYSASEGWTYYTLPVYARGER